MSEQVPFSPKPEDMQSGNPAALLGTPEGYEAATHQHEQLVQGRLASERLDVWTDTLRHSLREGKTRDEARRLADEAVGSHASKVSARGGMDAIAEARYQDARTSMEQTAERAKPLEERNLGSMSQEEFEEAFKSRFSGSSGVRSALETATAGAKKEIPAAQPEPVVKTPEEGQPPIRAYASREATEAAEGSEAGNGIAEPTPVAPVEASRVVATGHAEPESSPEEPETPTETAKRGPGAPGFLRRARDYLMTSNTNAPREDAEEFFGNMENDPRFREIPTKDERKRAKEEPEEAETQEGEATPDAQEPIAPDATTELPTITHTSNSHEANNGTGGAAPYAMPIPTKEERAAAKAAKKAAKGARVKKNGNRAGNAVPLAAAEVHEEDVWQGPNPAEAGAVAPAAGRQGTEASLAPPSVPDITPEQAQRKKDRRTAVKRAIGAAAVIAMFFGTVAAAEKATGIGGWVAEAAKENPDRSKVG